MVRGSSSIWRRRKAAGQGKASVRMRGGKLPALPRVGAVARRVSARTFHRGCSRERSPESKVRRSSDPRCPPSQSSPIASGIRRRTTAVPSRSSRFACYPTRTVSVLPCDRASRNRESVLLLQTVCAQRVARFSLGSSARNTGTERDRDVILLRRGVRRRKVLCWSADKCDEARFRSARGSRGRAARRRAHGWPESDANRGS